MVRVLYFGNNRVALELLHWLRQQNAAPVGLVVHPQKRATCRAELIQASGLGADRIFEANRLRDSATLERIRRLEPELGLSVFFGYILRPELLRIFPRGCLNLHPGYLPYNRGCYPNVWSIIDQTPAGATIHYMDEGVDTGDIVARRKVTVSPTDTGQTLYARLEDACIALLKETWADIVAGRLKGRSQPTTEGSWHSLRDVESVDHIDLDRHYRARDLIDILRARTFPPHPGAYILHHGKKIHLRLELIPEGETSS